MHNENRFSAENSAKKPARRPENGQPVRPDRRSGKVFTPAKKRRNSGFAKPLEPAGSGKPAEVLEDSMADLFVQDAGQAAPVADKAGLVTTDENFLPGIKPVLELLESAPERIDCVFIRKGRRDKQGGALLDLCRARGVRFSLLEDKAYGRLYSGHSQGVLARLFEGGFVDFEDLLANAAAAPLPLILALDQVSDPGNAGTLARTLYALGGAGLVLPKHQGAFLGGAAAKAAAGALQKLPVSKVTNLAVALDQAAEAGFAVYGAAAGEGTRSVYDFAPDFPAVLVLGSEGSGLRPGIAKRCDALLSVPMRRDFDSLNVAQAGAILMGFLSARRG